jgi:hypothetical protein
MPVMAGIRTPLLREDVTRRWVTKSGQHIQKRLSVDQPLLQRKSPHDLIRSAYSPLLTQRSL